MASMFAKDYKTAIVVFCILIISEHISQHAVVGQEEEVTELPCFDAIRGIEVVHGSQFTPDKKDPCFQCQCDKGFPTMCTLVACSPPCTNWRAVEGRCCQFVCLDVPLNGTGGGKTGSGGTGSTKDSGSGHSGIMTLSLRLVASTVTIVLVLAVLLFLVQRLRRRRIIILRRRMEQAQDNCGELDGGQCPDDPNYLGIFTPPYDDLPPPYSPPKPPSIGPGELPPPYETIDRNVSIIGESPRQNGLSQTVNQTGLSSEINSSSNQHVMSDSMISRASTGTGHSISNESHHSRISRISQNSFQFPQYLETSEPIDTQNLNYSISSEQTSVQQEAQMQSPADTEPKTILPCDADSYNIAPMSSNNHTAMSSNNLTAMSSNNQTAISSNSDYCAPYNTPNTSADGSYDTVSPNRSSASVVSHNTDSYKSPPQASNRCKDQSPQKYFRKSESMEVQRQSRSPRNSYHQTESNCDVMSQSLDTAMACKKLQNSSLSSSTTSPSVAGPGDKRTKVSFHKDPNSRPYVRLGSPDKSKHVKYENTASNSSQAPWNTENQSPLTNNVNLQPILQNVCQNQSHVKTLSPTSNLEKSTENGTSNQISAVFTLLSNDNISTSPKPGAGKLNLALHSNTFSHALNSNLAQGVDSTNFAGQNKYSNLRLSGLLNSPIHGLDSPDTPVSPCTTQSSRDDMCRTSSINSDLSLFSVCSETGEKRKSKAGGVLCNDSQYPDYGHRASNNNILNPGKYRARYDTFSSSDTLSETELPLTMNHARFNTVPYNKQNLSNVDIDSCELPLQKTSNPAYTHLKTSDLPASAVLPNSNTPALSHNKDHCDKGTYIKYSTTPEWSQIDPYRGPGISEDDSSSESMSDTSRLVKRDDIDLKEQHTTTSSSQASPLSETSVSSDWNDSFKHDNFMDDANISSAVALKKAKCEHSSVPEPQTERLNLNHSTYNTNTSHPVSGSKTQNKYALPSSSHDYYTKQNAKRNIPKLWDSSEGNNYGSMLPSYKGSMFSSYPTMSTVTSQSPCRDDPSSVGHPPCNSSYSICESIGSPNNVNSARNSPRRGSPQTAENQQFKTGRTQSTTDVDKFSKSKLNSYV